MSETLFGVLLAGMLWVAMHARHHPTPWWFAAGGALMGLAALARGEVLLLGALMFTIIGVATGGTWLAGSTGGVNGGSVRTDARSVDGAQPDRV